MLPVGTLANVGAIVAGSAIGMLLGQRFPQNIRTIVFQGLGLSVLVIGLQMAFKMDGPLVIIFSILIGGIIGEAIGLEERFASLGNLLKARLKSRNPKFTDGLVTASLIFCIGSMAIIGSFDEGLRGDHTVLLTKALLDGFASIALAATYGSGVVFSAVPLFLYQYGLTLFAGMFQSFFSPAIISQLTATGGLMIVAIGINLLELKYIKLSNFLPALPVAVLLAWLVG
jgi:uncharacterized membrane protein YqgA involved in biofilm formation